jgi:hypothetical protein
MELSTDRTKSTFIAAVAEEYRAFKVMHGSLQDWDAYAGSRPSRRFS